jgi:hypothetical protein
VRERAYEPLSLKTCALGINKLLINLIKTTRKKTMERLRRNLLTIKKNTKERDSIIVIIKESGCPKGGGVKGARTKLSETPRATLVLFRFLLLFSFSP